MGERPPLLTLVTVRAMVPVAGMPPKKGVTKLATPWAMSSWLGLCLSPMRPSAMRAHSKDSMAPSSVKVKMGMLKCCRLAKLNSGQTKLGNSDGMPPNLLPMVSTGSCSKDAINVAAMRATMEPGTTCKMRLSPFKGAWPCGAENSRCHTTIRANEPHANANAGACKVGSASCKVRKMPKKSAGMLLT